MNLNIDIATIKEKAIQLIPVEHEDKFREKFDSEICYDLIENAEDYLAEGLASYFLNNDI
jgi:hypothetical protein